MNVKAEAKRTGTAARLRARCGEIAGSNTGVASSVYCNLVDIPEQLPRTLANYVCAIPHLSTMCIEMASYFSEGTSNETAEWSNQHVGVLLGCSFTFETAPAADGLKPPNMIGNKAPPVYTVQLNPSGVFTGAYMAGAKYLGVEVKLKSKDVDFGERSELQQGEIPVALRAAKILGFSMAHFPVAMFVTDLTANSSIP
ncbi:hypothetical protein BDW69DRAFT_195486 [Aspergillus filifer]